MYSESSVAFNKPTHGSRSSCPPSVPSFVLSVELPAAYTDNEPTHPA